MAADGQVTLGESVIKHSARKIRRLYQDKILAGFAGSTADAFSLFSRFETKLEQYAGNLGRSAVELAKDWRTDVYKRQVHAGALNLRSPRPPPGDRAFAQSSEMFPLVALSHS